MALCQQCFNVNIMHDLFINHKASIHFWLPVNNGLYHLILAMFCEFWCSVVWPKFYDFIIETEIIFAVIWLHMDLATFGFCVNRRHVNVIGKTSGGEITSILLWILPFDTDMAVKQSINQPISQSVNLSPYAQHTLKLHSLMKIVTFLGQNTYLGLIFHIQLSMQTGWPNE